MKSCCRHWPAVRAILAVSILAMLPACIGHQYSYDRKGETVELTMNEQRARIPLAAAVVPVVVGFAVDIVRAELEKEAGRYEAQFIGSTYQEAFWNGPLGQDGEYIPKFDGFELVRWTTQKPKEKNEPAFKFVANILPSNVDRRFFLIRPVSFECRTSKAKIAIPGSKVMTTFAIALDATWIDKNLAVRQERVANAQWAVSGCDLNKPGERTKFGLEDTVGWFVAPPLSYRDDDHDGHPDKEKDPKNPNRLLRGSEGRGTPFRLTVIVTERDESKAKQYIERVGTFIGEQKPKIIEAVKGAVEQ